MKTKDIIATTCIKLLVLLTCIFGVALAEVKPVEPCNFLSRQHPEWPPIPACPEGVRYRYLDTGECEMFDEDHVYNETPEPATNALAKARIAMDFNFTINTNAIAARPGIAKTLKRAILADAERITAKGNPSEQVEIARRTLRHLDAIDDVVRKSTNAPAVKLNTTEK